MKWIFTIVLMVSLQNVFAQILPIASDDSIESRIVIIGDAGDPGSVTKGKAVVLDAIKSTIAMDKKTTVLFVGDNLYVNGLPNEQDALYSAGAAALSAQADVVKGTPAHAYFIPGNHDWANGKPEGYGNILRQGAYVNNIGDNIKFLPEDGCPGPVEVPLGKNAVMIIMDSQWWLTRGQKPGLESDCAFKTEDEILAGLKDIVDHNSHKLIIFACHHTFKSTGVHSGYYGIKQHIFPFTDLNKNLYIPLPVLGSIYPISRGVFGGPQDLNFPLYVNMINRIEGVLKNHPYVVHVAGHEHSLQLINDSNYHYIVSGGGCKSQRVDHSKKTKYAAAKRGFAVLDILKDKNVKVTFYELEPNTNEVKIGYTGNILNFSLFPELAKDTVTVHDLVYQDSATIPANKDYADVSGFKRLMLGNNYRKEWATPVKLKVFNVNKEHGGFKIEGLGGGKQTRSLHLKDTAGVKWTLRTLNKDPAKAIPENFRNTFAADIVQDMISAANPYGALPVSPMASALGIVHATPQYFIVPDDYAFGIYRLLFANTMCMLEEQDPTEDGSKGKSTFAMFNKLRDKDNHKVDQKTFLKARMLDFLIADYDRHQDQWKWGSIDSGKRKIYYPVPHDRDQALFHSDGLVMKYATWRRLPFLKGFRYDIPKVTWLGYVARYMDRTYLNELDEKEWKETLQEFKTDLSDTVIAEAVKQFPPEIAILDSSSTAAKLKSRRDLMPSKGMIYYKFISKRVNVLGSNRDEFFHVSKADKGILVNVYSRKKDNDSGLLMYSRQFDPRVTKEVRLYGFNGNDMFQVDDDVKSKIKLRMIGGAGEDTFNVSGRMPNFIYDINKEKNVVQNHNKTRNRLSSDPAVNNYNEKEENYTIWRFPHLEMGYNAEDGFLVGVGLNVRTFNFRKTPYSTDQKFATLFAPADNAYQIKYAGAFLDLFKKTDIVADGEFIHPTLNNFFGFGNDSRKIDGADIHYYRVRYTDIDGSILVRKRFFQNVLSIGIGPTYFYYSNRNENDRDRILAHPSVVGLDSTSVYTPKSYAGGKLSMNVNNLNAELFPTRGIDWTTNFTSMQGLDGNSKPITKLESNMAIYASLSEPARVVAVLKLGGGHIFSSQYEYFQALTLGANNYLRGFRKDRFAGSSLAYADIELRVKLFDIKSYIVPGALGIVAFNDLGRVWVANEHSHTWHDAYGGGLYYTPFNTMIISATTAFSGEELLFNFTVGTKITLTF
ncbi:MAG: BamA/TamA family outer membrane protein [Taibaiella sp.]|nr:BamA/TamA family outer membrane protein [Taibaiella sp.]